MSQEWRENWKWPCFEKWPQNQNLSFFSEDNALSDEEEKSYIYSNIKVTKTERSAFFGTPGISPNLKKPPTYEFKEATYI